MPRSRLQGATATLLTVIFGCATPATRQRMVVILPFQPSKITASVRNSILHIGALSEGKLYEARTPWIPQRKPIALKEVAEGVVNFVAAPQGLVYARRKEFWYKGKDLHLRLPTQVPPLALCELGGKLYAWLLAVAGKRAKRVLWLLMKERQRVLFEQEGWGVAVWLVSVDGKIAAGTESLILLLTDEGGEIIEHKGAVKGGAAVGGRLWLAFVNGKHLVWEEVEPERKAIQKKISEHPPKKSEIAPVIVLTGHKSFGVWEPGKGQLTVFHGGGRYVVGLADVRGVSLDGTTLYRTIWPGGRAVAVEKLAHQSR